MGARSAAQSVGKTATQGREYSRLFTQQESKRRELSTWRVTRSEQSRLVIEMSRITGKVRTRIQLIA
jgi:hypothetical protein